MGCGATMKTKKLSDLPKDYKDKSDRLLAAAKSFAESAKKMKEGKR